MKSVFHACLIAGTLLRLGNALDSRPNFSGRLFCDVKTALNSTTLNETNAHFLLGALVKHLGCTGLRVPLIPRHLNPQEYEAGFNVTLRAARAMNLTLYASPMERAWPIVAASAPSEADPEAAYTSWVSDFAAAFAPLDFLSPFNEVGDNCDPACTRRVASAVRAGDTAGPLPPATLLVGPDAMHVSSSLAIIHAQAGFQKAFQVLSSHNAAHDDTETVKNWALLVAAAGEREAWSSENPDCFTLPQCTKYGTMAQAVAGGVQGIVTWRTLGNDVDFEGNITDSGRDVVEGLGMAAL